MLACAEVPYYFRAGREYVMPPFVVVVKGLRGVPLDVVVRRGAFLFQDRVSLNCFTTVSDMQNDSARCPFRVRLD